jgi:hypothetical protein
MAVRLSTSSTDQKDAPNTVTKEMAAEVTAEFMTTFYCEEKAIDAFGAFATA